MPAMSVHSPRSTNSSPNLAFSEATRRSAIIASSIPQPTAAPLTAATTGTLVCRIASAAGVSRGVVITGLSRFSPPAITARTSSPEQNAGSVPVITRHRAVVARTAASSRS